MFHLPGEDTEPREIELICNARGTRRALLIGVNEYDFLGELSFAQRDAEIFSSALVDHCGFEESDVQVMSCSARGGLRAQGRYIEEMLSSLTDMEELDLLVFGFWGHGFSSDDGALYLCGFDARENNLERTAVPLSLVKAKLAQVGAKDTLMILDCCQARVAGRGAANTLSKSTAVELEQVARLAKIERDAKEIGLPHIRSAAMITSCKEGQSAYEWHERQHGVFTAHLIDGLTRGIGRASALADYLSEQVPQTAQSLYRQQQTPWYVSEGRGDIVLLSDRNEQKDDEEKTNIVATQAADRSSLMRFSADIRDLLFVHRRSNPCKIATLFERYNSNNSEQRITREQFSELIQESRSAGLLSGFYFNSDLAFLSVELLSAKLDLNRSAKEQIARYAALRVCSGMTIGIDSGSTTLAFVREIISMLECSALDDLKIITNSMAIANEFTEALVRMEQGDKKGLCHVTLIGGWCRPTSLATVPESDDQISKLVGLGIIPKEVDLSFVAANGFFEKRGFANSHTHEVPCKRYLSQAAPQTIYLMESRKLEIAQNCLIEEFREGMELITESSLPNSPSAAEILENIRSSGATVSVCDG